MCLSDRQELSQPWPRAIGYKVMRLLKPGMWGGQYHELSYVEGVCYRAENLNRTGGRHCMSQLDGQRPGFHAYVSREDAKEHAYCYNQKPVRIVPVLLQDVHTIGTTDGSGNIHTAMAADYMTILKEEA